MPPEQLTFAEWTLDAPAPVRATSNDGVYYNEIAGFPIAWLRELAAAGAIPDGHVDGRSIEAVEAKDVAGYDVAHFFAGIGVWSYAVEQAGWPRSGLTIWSASLPCQPFSPAGKKRGFADDRHLWPALFRLVQQCRPSILVGEQTSSPAGLAWWDVVSTDLEDEGYACGALDLSAAGFGSPQKRQRLYWWAARLADASHIKRELQRGGFASSGRWQESSGNGRAPGAARPTAGFWADVAWLDCSDGSSRPTQPGLCTVADGSPGAVEQLRAFGNAVNAEVAIEFLVALRATLAGLHISDEGGDAATFSSS